MHDEHWLMINGIEGAFFQHSVTKNTALRKKCRWIKELKKEFKSSFMENASSERHLENHLVDCEFASQKCLSLGGQKSNSLYCYSLLWVKMMLNLCACLIAHVCGSRKLEISSKRVQMCFNTAWAAVPKYAGAPRVRGESFLLFTLSGC